MANTSINQADETINLDDDSLLSPDTEELPAPSPLEQLDQERHDGLGQNLISEGGLEGNVPEYRSMENILLETSPTVESINLQSTENLLDLDESAVEPTIDNDEPGEKPVTFSIDPLDDRTGTENEKSENNDSVGDISSYFASPPPVGGENPSATAFFDSLGAVNKEQGKQDPNSFFDNLGPVKDCASSESQESEAVTAPKIGEEEGQVLSPDQGDDNKKTRTESLSSTGGLAQEEAVPVSFEEVKGKGDLKFVGSTENVSKFFTEDGGGSDLEGKSFFESFTAGGSGDNTQQVPASPKLKVDIGMTDPGQSGTVMQTPPIPGSTSSPLPTPPLAVPTSPPTPPIAIPGSPIHSPRTSVSGSAPSQASPIPSPAHIVTPQSSVEKPRTISDPAESLSPPPADGPISAFQQGDDVFAASLNMSDADRRSDVWLPTESTRQALVSMVTSPPGTYFPEPEQLTMPGLVIDDPQGDPVKDLVQRYIGEKEASNRVTLTADSVPQDEEGLKRLISAECYRAAIDLTGKLIATAGQGKEKVNQLSKHTPQTLQLWYIRFALLMKLRLYTNLESECAAFGNLDRPDLYYEYYPEIYPGRRGSMVPFSLRVLHAELPQYLGKSQEALDRLYYIHAICKKILANLEAGLAEDGSMIQLSEESRTASRELWESRENKLLYAVGNCLLNVKDYCTSIEIFESLLRKDERNKHALLCGIGRIYLQMGDVASAQQYFDKAEEGGDQSDPVVKCSHFMNKGFVALGENKFTEAEDLFKEAMQADPTNAVVINNMAVCSLYNGRLKQALYTLESLVQQDPAQYLQEGILFNLCTLYELESSRAIQKKQALLELVTKHKGNGFNIACLKMA